MKFKITILVFFILLVKITFCQVASNNEINGSDKGETIPHESVFVHVNTGLVFTGEYFYYSIYCINNKTKKPSNMSKVAYIELVGKNGEVVFKHKVKLVNGRGYSDFFIPVDISSGNYKLVAYTNWMRNTEINNWFVADINILNPYKTNKSTYVIDVDRDKDTIPEFNEFVSRDDFFDIVLNKKNFGKREKVSFSIKENSKLSGSYSVSVRRKSKIPEPQKNYSVNFIKELLPNYVEVLSTNKTKIFLPELRGELFQGKVSTKNQEGQSDNLKVAVSIPDEEHKLKIVKINEKGEFFFNVDDYYTTDNFYIQVLGEKANSYDITLNNQSDIKTSELQFYEFKIKSSWKDEILKQSVYNQIESAYFEFKPDSLVLKNSQKLFENKANETYKLNDFTRFPTLRETFQEVVKNISIKKFDDNNYSLEVQGFVYGTNSGIKPLVVLDGIVMQNHTFLMDLNAYQVDEIKIYRDQFVFGLEVFQGAVVIKTTNGIDDNTLANTSIKKVEVFKSQLHKSYYLQKYSDENKEGRIPDFRQQLFWMPNLEIKEGNKPVHNFYTSDISGVYIISIEGFTNDGLPISLTKQFLVN